MKIEITRHVQEKRFAWFPVIAWEKENDGYTAIGSIKRFIVWLEPVTYNRGKQKGYEYTIHEQKN